MRTYKEISEEQLPTTEEDGGITSLAWCPDGQILTAATGAGDVFNFLARMPTVHASFGPCVAFLSSLRQVSVVDVARSGDKPLNVPVSIEPTIVGLGPAHVAVAMNDRVIFYRATRKDKSRVCVDDWSLPITFWRTTFRSLWLLPRLDSGASYHVAAVGLEELGAFILG